MSNNIRIHLPFLQVFATGIAFGMEKSTLRLITIEIFKITSKELVQEFRPVKTEPHPIYFFSDFCKRYFPSRFCCIYGRHCQGKCPLRPGTAWYCYQKHYSDILKH
jgi:hypothetical protein